MSKNRLQGRCREVLKIYTDESVPVAVAEGLRRRGIEAWSARDAGKLGMSDEEEQLNYACQQRAVIFTHDADFLKIARQ
jgi:predicted nuclease of predicted toxin-antitoxin system